MRTITFGKFVGKKDLLFNLELDCIRTERKEFDGHIITGEFEYTSDPAFGSSTSSNGEIYLNPQTDLVGFVTYYDRPKATKIIRSINDELGCPIHAPKYEQEASAQFYKTFGFNGYTTSFREDLKDYSIHSSFKYIEPDEIMERRAMNSRRNPSEEWLEEITSEFIDDGYYVSSMDCTLKENGGNYSFSNPMRLTAIKEKDWDKNLRNLIFKRMNQILKNDVPTVDEVLSN